MTLSKPGAEAGQRVAVAGHGFAKRAPVRIALGARTVRRSRTGPRGGFRVAFRVPGRPARLVRIKVFVRGRSVRRRFRIREGAEAQTLVAAGDIACSPSLEEAPTHCRHARTATWSSDGTRTPSPCWATPRTTRGRWRSSTRRTIRPGGGSRTSRTPRRGTTSTRVHRSGMSRRATSRTSARSPAFPRGGTTAGSSGIGPCWPSTRVRSSTREGAAAPLARTTAGRCHAPREAPRSGGCGGSSRGSEPAPGCSRTGTTPGFSSGFGGAHQPHPETEPLFRALYEHRAELVLTGQAHNYERFGPRSPDGRPDERGVTQFVVGTGGNALHRRTGTPLTTTLRTDVFGVLELTLAPDGWRSRFVSEHGTTTEEPRATVASPALEGPARPCAPPSPR